MMRATGSVEPPGGKGTTIFIGPLGHSPRLSARTMAGAASSVVVPASTARRRRVRWRGLVNLVLPDSFVVLFPYTSALRMGKPDSFTNRDVEGIAVGILALAARREPVAQDLRQLGAAADQLGPRGVDVLGPEANFGRPPADFRGAVVQGDDAAVGIELLPALLVLDEVQPQHVAIEGDHARHGLGEQHDPTHRQQHLRPPSGDHPGTVRFFCQARPHRLFNRNMRFLLALLCVLSALGTTPLQAADRLDPTPRVAVISAFEPEWKVLKADIEGAKSTTVNGVEFVTGKLGGRNVVLFLSGVSMVNAAMTTQLALDRFDVTGIVVSGIAGGVDPSLHVGDVVVAGRWGQYLEAVFAREVNGRFEPPPFIKTPFPNHGMIFPTELGVRSAKAGLEKRFWFDADPGMMAAAGKIG